VRQTADGGFIILGSTMYGMGTTGYDGYVIKTDQYGDQERSTVIGGDYTDLVGAVRQTDDDADGLILHR